MVTMKPFTESGLRSMTGAFSGTLRLVRGFFHGGIWGGTARRPQEGAAGSREAELISGLLVDRVDSAVGGIRRGRL